jgi:light-regulated signal transduction histidine kinase (bacteriophytochrome)
MVASYLQLLERRYAGSLDDDAREFIGYAVDGAGRMKRLINDLLDYSRAGNVPLRAQSVDAGEIVGTILKTLSIPIAEAHAQVTVEPLPTVTADGEQLGRVFQNLVANALKYRSRAAPRIRIVAEPIDGYWKFSVGDNGIGIDPRFADKVFEIFKRLHGRDKYPGTGIGLAICRLVVDRHGGRIWVEPRPNGGSIFNFTIPR